MSEELVIELCGDYPEGFIKPDIESNPNYVFDLDPNFTPVRLFDLDENTVFVNSFTECQHYVLGGWGYQPSLINESDFHKFLLILLIFAIMVGFVQTKKAFIKKYYEIFKR